MKKFLLIILLLVLLITIMTVAIYAFKNNYWSYVNILDTKSQTFLCCTSS